EITPGNFPKKTMFANSGAEAVENAVKIARKYTGRTGVISFERGLHGRTVLAMSMTSKVKPYKHGFVPFAPSVYTLRYPYYYRAPEGMSPENVDEMILQAVNDFFIKDAASDEIGAMIVEPVQGEGGFVVPSKNFIQGLKKICEQHGILLIADEIQTGFARTGNLFAIQHFDVEPDLITMSKSIAAGLPLSAITGRAEVMDAPEPGQLGGTFGGSPISCAAGLAVLDIIEEENLVERARQIGRTMEERLQQMKEKFDLIGDVRGLGAMWAMELVKDRKTKEPAKEETVRILEQCWKRGLITISAGMYGNVIRFMPPLVIRDEELEEGLFILEEAVSKIAHS